MGVVGSLPSPSSQPSSPLISIDKIKTQFEESTLSNDGCSYSVLTMSENESNSQTDEQKKASTDESSNFQSGESVSYGPITVRVRQIHPPTLATGRRSKFLQLEGVAAVKRELRRRKNRDAAKKLKEKRFLIEQHLQKDIQDLESKEQELESRIRNLEAYKQRLELRCRTILSMQEKFTKTASSTLPKPECNGQQSHQNVPNYSVYTKTVKDEPRSSSPQWQLLFSI